MDHPMTVEAFEESTRQPEPSAGLSPALLALWHDARGDWDEAHRVAQDIDTAMGSRIHAYLHRKEGDLNNATYWYRQAGVSVERAGLDEEWRQLVADALVAAP